MTWRLLFLFLCFVIHSFVPSRSGFWRTIPVVSRNLGPTRFSGSRAQKRLFAVLLGSSSKLEYDAVRSWLSVVCSKSFITFGVFFFMSRESTSRSKEHLKLVSSQRCASVFSGYGMPARAIGTFWILCKKKSCLLLCLWRFR